jgi:Zn-dependent protease
LFGFDADMIFRIPALLIALTVHEYAHARAAVSLGDPTPRLLGRLTLNPVAHLDPIGLIMLWLFKFGWAKPVPINPSYFKNYRQDMLLVSLAGPVSNMLLALLTAFLIVILAKMQLLGGGWIKVLSMTYTYNIILAIFNLVPIPPLDGSKVLASILPAGQGRI